ncbi:MAG TPA: hypothetical protein DCO77_11150, partial [Nitrospiraceae bacterium]|nr:hypothetical protein [Nitrospiraceae bacterium]
MAGPFVDKDGEVSFVIGINKADPDIGQFGGAVLIRYSLKTFLAYLDKIKVSGEEVVWVLAPNGSVLKQPDMYRIRLDPRPYVSPDIESAPRFFLGDVGIVVHQDFSIVPGRPLIRIVISVPSDLLFEEVRSVL